MRTRFDEITADRCGHAARRKSVFSNAVRNLPRGPVTRHVRGFFEGGANGPRSSAPSGQER
jgi:hypothetical protein